MKSENPRICADFFENPPICADFYRNGLISAQMRGLVCLRICKGVPGLDVVEGSGGSNGNFVLTL